MDDVQLRWVLDIRCYERCHVGTCIINACDRFILVCIYVEQIDFVANAHPIGGKHFWQSL